MATREVVIPQRANPLNNLMNMAQTGNNLYQGGSTIGKFGGWLGDLFGGGEEAAGDAPTTTAPTVDAPSAAAPTTTAPTVATPSAAAPTSAAPTVSAGGASGGAAAGSEYGIATLGPAAMAGAAGAFQIKANNDYQRRGEKSGNAPYAMKYGPAIQGSMTEGPGSWNSESIARRMGAKEGFKSSDLVDASKSVEVLPLSRADKDNILGKLGEAFNISKLVKF